MNQGLSKMPTETHPSIIQAIYFSKQKGFKETRISKNNPVGFINLVNGSSIPTDLKKRFALSGKSILEVFFFS